jgi:2-dehydropantoate 2-reductase
LVKLLGYNNKFKKAVSFALIPLAMKKHKKLVSGMYYDLKKGRQCDIDFVCGVVAENGKKVGILTPVCDGVIAIAHKIERGELGITTDNLQQLKTLL